MVKSPSSSPTLGMKRSKVMSGLMKSMVGTSRNNISNKDDRANGGRLQVQRAEEASRPRPKKTRGVYDLDMCPYDSVSDPSLDKSSDVNGWRTYGLVENKNRDVRIIDPDDEDFIGEMACELISKIPIDRRSIGGENLYQRLQVGGTAIENEVMTSLVNESLLTMRVSRFDTYARGQRPHGFSAPNNNILIDKTNKKNKSRLRYLAIIRTTNRPLKVSGVSSKTRPKVNESSSALGLDREGEEKQEIDDCDDSEVTYDNDEEEQGNSDEETDVQYDNMFTSDSANQTMGASPSPSTRKGDDKKNLTQDGGVPLVSYRRNLTSNIKNSSRNSRRMKARNMQDAAEVEISSFPILLFFSVQLDGTIMDVRKTFDLDQLISVECLPISGSFYSMPSGSENNVINNKKIVANIGLTPSRVFLSALSSSDVGSIVLTFKNGEVAEIDCEFPDRCNPLVGTGGVTSTVEGDVDAGDTLVVVPGAKNGADASSSLHHSKEHKCTSHASTSVATGSAPKVAVGGALGSPVGTDAASRHDFFLWCLLQIHTMLCTSVVERNILNHHRLQKAAINTPQWKQQSSSQPSLATSFSNTPSITPLPPLSLRNVDRSELQYLCTVNGFLEKNRMVMSLLKRQRSLHPHFIKKEVQLADDNNHPEIDILKGGESSSDFRLEDLAHEVLMTSGGSGSSLLLTGAYQASIFSSPEEEADAQEVINSASAQYLAQLLRTSSISASEAERQTFDVAVTGENLHILLQKRMRQLETDACKRLIAWEDEKRSSAAAIDLQSTSRRNQRDCVGFLSLVDLFATLDELDAELAQMEAWLQDRAAFIRPLSNDCHEIEEENRGLEQQWKSYALLGDELTQLLSGLEVSPKVTDVLKNPRKVLAVNRKSGAVDNEKGIDIIKGAGRELKGALDRAVERGGLHLRAINDCVKELLSLSSTFCSELSAILTDVIRLLVADAIPQIDPSKLPKSETHASMARKIRDIQRKVQSSLLVYIKLIEILALLKPESLPIVRQVYSEVVSEGILSKKMMKAYFNLLPGHVYAVGSETATQDLKDYPLSSLKSNNSVFIGGDIAPVSAEDIGLALTEMLPVIAREAYFTAALFGLSGNKLDGREKKQNFESVKKSVDDSSIWFRYYLSRACGIAEAEGGKPTHVMLSLVASIHLNESMEGYMDRQKKGGDHSLSLAYVRATILDFRKKVDKKWVEWVEEQIRWIRSSPGVPLNGKRAGVCLSFAKFPSYLDHLISSCRAGRNSDYVVNLAKVKVISYYLQKLAGALFANLQENSAKDTTDQQYAANVMRMENSFFFLESIKKRGPEFTSLFHKQLVASGAIYKQSTDAYLGWMIKREFKALHSLFSNISKIRREVGDADVPIHVPRSTFVKTLSKESSREVMKEKIATMYLRMEKHLCPESSLFPIAWKSLVRVLYEWFGRWEKLSSHCYSFKLEPGAVEVVRIAKLAGGGTKKNVQRVDGIPS